MRIVVGSTIALVSLVAAVAHADPDGPGLTASLPADEIGDQAVGAELGIASGGRVTPGGLRVTGHYLYQLSATDWFDGTASFTYGSGGSACAVDAMATLRCEHGFTSGNAVELAATVRHMFPAQGAFRPFARAGVGVSRVWFGGDELSGLAVPVHLGAGVRAHLAPSVAVITQAELQAGLGGFSRGLGAEPQLGLALTAGAEFRLR